MIYFHNRKFSEKKALTTIITTTKQTNINKREKQNGNTVESTLTLTFDIRVGPKIIEMFGTPILFTACKDTTLKKRAKRLSFHRNKLQYVLSNPVTQ